MTEEQRRQALFELAERAGLVIEHEPKFDPDEEEDE